MPGKFILAGAVTLAGAATSEVVSLWIVRDVLEEPGIFRSDGYTSVALRSDVTARHAGRDFGVVYRVNAHGFRGPLPEEPKPRGESRVLLLGDSFAFGHGVEEGQTVGAYLEKEMQQLGTRARVLNAGHASGVAPDDALAFLRSPRARGLAPDIVVELTYLGNDLRDVEGHVWDVVDEQGLPRVVRASTDGANAAGGRGVLPWFHGVPLLRQSNALRVLARLHFVYFRLPERVSAIRRWREQLLEGEKPDTVARYSSLFPALRLEAEALGATRFVVGVIPAWGGVGPDLARSFNDYLLSALGEALTLAEIPFVVLDESVGIGPAHHFPNDGHWSPAGHREAAVAITSLISPVDR